MKKTTYTILSICILFIYRSTNLSAQTISAGTAHSAALCSSDSIVRDWGANGNGQLGINDTTEQNTPVMVHGPGNVGFMKSVKQIVIRENFSVALRYDSTVWAWGFNGDGELGNNSHTDSWTPVQVHGPGNVGYLHGITQISAGYAHVLALKFDGTVLAWGDNLNGELGDSTTVSKPFPVQVRDSLNISFLNGITKIAAGQQFSMALMAGGFVMAWGLDTNGELGDNNTKDKHIPVQVHGAGNVGMLAGITDIAAGGQHALALRIDSTVWSWGFNINGELGNNTMNSDSVPAQVHGPGNVGFLGGATTVKAGDYFSAIIAGDSTVWAWGFNFYGQLGINDTTQQNTPVHVHGTNNSGFITQVTEIALGDEHMIMKKSDGSLRACGWNANGQIGDGTTTDRWAPVMVMDPCSLSLAVPTIENANEVSIYPNPALNTIAINCGTSLINELRIYNTIGQQVYHSMGSKTATQYVNVSSFPAGVYLTQLYTNTGFIQAKFIVQK
jgi:alpha-tubulin suppressor-like RCC1 family protein